MDRQVKAARRDPLMARFYRLTFLDLLARIDDLMDRIRAMEEAAKQEEGAD